MPYLRESLLARPGDPPRLIADVARARDQLDWQPKYTEIEEIVATAWEWHRQHPNGYGERGQATSTKASALVR